MAKEGKAKLYALQPQAGSLMQSIVLRTKGGKLIVFDGGLASAGKNEGAYMPAALRAIAGVAEGERVEVEAWFLSHAHKDHFWELNKTLRHATEDRAFFIKGIYFDFPPYGSEEYPYDTEDAEQLRELKESLEQFAAARGIEYAEQSYYDERNGKEINAKTIADGSAGMEIDGVRLEFLQTWDFSCRGNINDTSLVLRIWAEGKSVLLLHDAHVAAGNRLLARYGDRLKSDIVQTAHHGQRGVTKEVYDAIRATTRIWCAPIWVWEDVAKYEIGKTRSWVNGGVDFTEPRATDIVCCAYAEYPEERSSVAAWKRVVEGMSVPL